MHEKITNALVDSNTLRLDFVVPEGGRRRYYGGCSLSTFSGSPMITAHSKELFPEMVYDPKIDADKIRKTKRSLRKRLKKEIDALYDRESKSYTEKFGISYNATKSSVDEVIEYLKSNASPPDKYLQFAEKEIAQRLVNSEAIDPALIIESINRGDLNFITDRDSLEEGTSRYSENPVEWSLNTITNTANTVYHNECTLGRRLHIKGIDYDHYLSASRGRLVEVNLEQELTLNEKAITEALQTFTHERIHGADDSYIMAYPKSKIPDDQLANGSKKQQPQYNSDKRIQKAYEKDLDIGLRLYRAKTALAYLISRSRDNAEEQMKWSYVDTMNAPRYGEKYKILSELTTASPNQLVKIIDQEKELIYTAMEAANIRPPALQFLEDKETWDRFNKVVTDIKRAISREEQPYHVGTEEQRKKMATEEAMANLATMTTLHGARTTQALMPNLFQAIYNEVMIPDIAKLTKGRHEEFHYTAQQKSSKNPINLKIIDKRIQRVAAEDKQFLSEKQRFALKGNSFINDAKAFYREAIAKEFLKNLSGVETLSYGDEPDHLIIDFGENHSAAEAFRDHLVQFHLPASCNEGIVETEDLCGIHFSNAVNFFNRDRAKKFYSMSVRVKSELYEPLTTHEADAIKDNTKILEPIIEDHNRKRLEKLRKLNAGACGHGIPRTMAHQYIKGMREEGISDEGEKLLQNIELAMKDNDLLFGSIKTLKNGLEKYKENILAGGMGIHYDLENQLVSRANSDSPSINLIANDTTLLPKIAEQLIILIDQMPLDENKTQGNHLYSIPMGEMIAEYVGGKRDSLPTFIEIEKIAKAKEAEKPNPSNVTTTKVQKNQLEASKLRDIA